jgi:hypothetical protein
MKFNEFVATGASREDMDHGVERMQHKKTAKLTKGNNGNARSLVFCDLSEYVQKYLDASRPQFCHRRSTVKYFLTSTTSNK